MKVSVVIYIIFSACVTTVQAGQGAAKQVAAMTDTVPGKFSVAAARESTNLPAEKIAKSMGADVSSAAKGTGVEVTDIANDAKGTKVAKE